MIALWEEAADRTAMVPPRGLTPLGGTPRKVTARVCRQSLTAPCGFRVQHT
jgi:hypothetical protein